MASVKTKPKKPTPREQYKAQIKRLRRAVSRLEKAGFVFDKSPIPELPKRVTQKKLEEIKGLTPKKLRLQAIEKTAEAKPAKIEQKSTRRKVKPITKTPKAPQQRHVNNIPSMSYVILENIRELIRTWAPLPNWSPYFAKVKEGDKNILERILEGAVNSEGEKEVAKRLQRHATEVIDLANRICYSSGGKNGRDEVQMDLQRFSAIIMGRSMTVEESKEITNAVETYESDTLVE